MVTLLDPPLRPRQGPGLNVLGICRISTVHQDLQSLDDQEALLRRYITAHYDGLVNFHFIKSRDSGEFLDTRELIEAEERIEARRHDVLICEDLGRICRRHHAISICELCEDQDTRLIALNDNIDLARSDWRMNAFFASFKHESYNKDTSQRIRRTQRNRFTQGGIVQTTIYGYVKPTGTKNDADLRKDPAAEPIYDEMFRRLEDGATFAEIADWLNDAGISVGPYSRSKFWNAQMLGRVVRNPILKGVRVRNKKMSRRINKTGRRRSVDAPPEERLERNCPHLAFIDPERFDRVNALLTRRYAKFKRRLTDGIDPRKDVPKKRTRWPGQHLDCGICGRLFRYGGHGQATHLMCAGASGYQCWNAITADGPLSADKITTAILGEITALPGSDDTLMAMVHAEVERIRTAQLGRRSELDRRQKTLDFQLANIRATLREYGHSKHLLDDLRELEAALEQILCERAALDRIPQQMIAIPTLAEIKACATQAITSLVHDSAEFGRLMHRLVPQIRAHPYRLCDGGHPVLRAHFRLDLVALIPEAQGLEGCSEILRRDLVVNLFDPPQRVEYRERILSLQADGLTQRQIAVQLGITQPVVQHAVALTREMTKRGLTDPYVPLMEPPDDYSKLREHKHSRYRFSPMVGTTQDASVA